MDDNRSESSNGERPKWSHPGNQPDVYVRCPYFPEHELRRSRLAYHLPKCQKNPNAPPLLVCPFNFYHRVRAEDRKKHLETCEDRVAANRLGGNLPSFASTEKLLSDSKEPNLKAARIIESHSAPREAYLNNEPMEEEW